MFLNLDEIEKRLNISFNDRDLLALAFVHRSYWNEHQNDLVAHNERLEFLGDSVLGLIVGEYLYTHLPQMPEGHLSDLRAHIVDALSCVTYIHKLQLDDFILLGKGEKMNVGKGRESILADLFEAIMGAIYLDGGYQKAKNFFLSTFEPDLEKIVLEPIRNWKAELQDYSQKKFQEPPHYEVIDESGPAHKKHFKVAVYIKNNQMGIGEGGSKKEAQAHAAKSAIEKLENE